MGFEDLLSVGAINQILEGHRPANPVVQIIGYKPMTPDQMSVGPVTEELRYRLMIGDGIKSHQYCVITNQELIEDFTKGRLEKWSLIRITSYSTADYGDGPAEAKKRLIYILNLELVKKGSEVRCKLVCGTPDDPMSARPPAANNVMNPQQHQQQQYQPPQQPSNRYQPPPVTPIKQQPQQNYNSYDAITQPQPYPMAGGRSESIKSPRSMRGNNSRQTIKINELTPYIGKWIIKGRCIAKSALREYNNAKGPGKLFNFTLCDSSGEIRITAFNADCERVFDYIELQKGYILGNASVKTADKRYNKADFEITLNSDSLVELVSDMQDDLPKMKFNFVSLASLSNLQENAQVDVIGAITTVSDVTTVMSKTKNKELKKRNITIVDMSRHTVSVTIWGEAADTFNGQEKDVFITRDARISSYGGRTLSAGDVVFVNPPDLPEVRKIRAWYDNLIDRNFTALSASQDSVGNDQWKSLMEMTDLNKAREVSQGGQPGAAFAKCKGTILAVGKNPVYKCCPVDGCGKKLIDTQNGEMKCEKCQQTYSSYKYRYMTSVEVGDVTSSTWVTLWDDKAESIFNVKAEDLERTMRAENKEEYEKIISRPNFKVFIFTMRSRIDNYNNEEKVRLQVTNMIPMKSMDYGKRLIEEIKAMSAAAA